jgi:DNA replication licensing factor MCM7
MYVTPRTLLAIIRLSQSLAKLSFRTKVNQSDVDEAIKLMDFSIRSLRTLKTDNDKGDRSKARQAGREYNKSDRMSEVVKAIRELMSKTNSSGMKIGEILKALTKDRMLSIGQIDREELLEVINHYEKLQIILIQDETVIFL